MPAFVVDDHRFAVMHFALDDLDRQGIEHVLLDNSFQWASSVDRVVSLVRQQFTRTACHLHVDLPIAQSLSHRRQLNLDDLGKLLPGERLEDDDLVDTVQELGRKEARSASITFARISSSSSRPWTRCTANRGCWS